MTTLKCPKCEGTDVQKGWRPEDLEEEYGGYLKCEDCGHVFPKTKTAFMDGIFLDEYNDLTKRAMKYIEVGAEELKLSEKVVDTATSFVSRLFENHPKYKNMVRTTAAGVLRVAAVKHGERRTQRDVAEAFQTTVVSVRNKYKEICEKLKVECYTTKKERMCVPKEKLREGIKKVLNSSLQNFENRSEAEINLTTLKKDVRDYLELQSTDLIYASDFLDALNSLRDNYLLKIWREGKYIAQPKGVMDCPCTSDPSWDRCGHCSLLF